jgi:alternate signal-mediated exported protein
MSKHRATIPRSARPRRLAKGMAGTSVGIAVGVVIALAATSGTYAMWNDTKVIAPGEVTSGHVSLTINDVTSYAITGLDVTKLLPGRSVITTTPLIVRNAGVTPLRVTPGTVSFTDPSGTLASQLVVAVHQSATCTLTPTGTTPTSFTNFVLTPGQTATVCVEVQLKPAAPANVQGNTANFSLVLDALQVRL